MFIISLFIQYIYCTIVGVDLGSDSIKVAVGSKYNPIHLVRNIHSHESTPNIFTYIDKSHWSIGEDAKDQCLLHPERCVQNQKLPLNDNEYFTKDQKIKGYQIVALSLKKILDDVQKMENIEDEMKVVVAIPPSMTNREKSYLYNALKIAEINCVRFVTSTYAPIELYVNEKKYGARTDNSAVFIDIGHEGVRVSAFEFDQAKIQQKFGQYNDKIGGKTIDENLMKMIISKYKLNMEKDNEIEYQKNKIELISEIRKAREKLTVFPNGVSFDFKSTIITITRKDIDDCSIEIKRALTHMIQSLRLENPNILHSGCIQLLGGCSRILCLQEHIKKLLPNFKLMKTMDVTSAVSIGACYLITDEIQSNIQVHESLIPFEIALKTDDNVYNIFKFGNTDSFNPVVRLRNVESNHLFSIIEKNNNNHEFIRFRVNLPRYNYYNRFYSYNNVIDLGFKLNSFLMPVPDQSVMMNHYGEKISLSFDYLKVGWEISQDELTYSKNVINSLLHAIKQRLEVEKHLNSIDEYKISIQRKLDNYGFLNWRKFAFAGICRFIDHKCKSCIENNRIECSEEKINSILKDFKELVKFALNIKEDESNDKEEIKKQVAIDDLNELIESCKQLGIRCDDVKQWIKKNLKNASLEDIIKQIKALQLRGRETQK